MIQPPRIAIREPLLNDLELTEVVKMIHGPLSPLQRVEAAKYVLPLYKYIQNAFLPLILVLLARDLPQVTGYFVTALMCAGSCAVPAALISAADFCYLVYLIE